jgi:hypothetical protein
MPSTSTSLEADFTVSAVIPGVSVMVTLRTGGGLGVTAFTLPTSMAGTPPLVLGRNLTIKIQ